MWKIEKWSKLDKNLLNFDNILFYSNLSNLKILKENSKYLI